MIARVYRWFRNWDAEAVGMAISIFGASAAIVAWPDFSKNEKLLMHVISLPACALAEIGLSWRLADLIWSNKR